MSLVSGSRLGPYEISGKLGAGGMGEVYKARDTRLGRTVAIKVLPAIFADDAELRARLEREARAISSLQHPHICTLFDIGREGDRDFLVMEYLEGEPLASRLGRGKLSLEETLRFGKQIAEALDRAHRHGIVHRDLKPGNVILTKSGVKLLDFGLAKLQTGLTRPSSPDDKLDSRTVLVSSEPLTTAGTVVGTPEYMAPEQLEGQDIDARCDIWALGCVLYQMATGERPFARANLASVITAVMSSEPALPPEAAVPPGLERLIRFCLAKDPEQRWQSAYDLALELDSLSSGSNQHSLSSGSNQHSLSSGSNQHGLSSGSNQHSLAASARSDSATGLPAASPLGAPAGASRWRGLRQLGLGLAAGLLVAFWVWVAGRPEALAGRTLRFQLPLPAGVQILQSVEDNQLAVAPDGRSLAFIGVDAQRISRIYLRPLGEDSARPLAGTEGARSLIWSPDGKALAFFGGGKLKRLELGGGAPVTLCDVDPSIGYAGSWSRQGQIVFVSVQGKSMLRIAATGGVPEQLLAPDPARGETRIGWPFFLPDGQRLLYSLRQESDENTLMLLEPGHAPRPVAPLRSRAELIGKNQLVYVRDGALVAQQFDAEAARLVGAPSALAPAVSHFYSNGWAGFAAAPSGALFFVNSADSMRFYAYDRDGQRREALGTPGAYLNVSLAADGRSLLADRIHPMYGTYDIWQLDLARGHETRLTTSPAAEFAPFLLPGGKAMIYSVAKAAAPNLVRRPLLAGEEESLLPSSSFQAISDVAAAGDLLAYTERGEKGGFRGFVMSLNGERQARDLFLPGTEQRFLRFSPDARHLVFLSNDSGTFEAYVAPLDNPNDRIRLSRQGADHLRWRRDGREILWTTPQGEMMAAVVVTSPKLEIGEPRLLFTLPADTRGFDVATDGSRFILLVREKRGGAEPASVILDWAPEAER